MEAEGLLLVDKPVSWTSFDVVNKVRAVIAQKNHAKPKTIKVGHSGTLDPMASGLLILAIGRATKQISTLTKLDKTYQVEATLGATSDTGDAEGKIDGHAVVLKPDFDTIKSVLQQFIGEIDQVPHRYSAIKINGVRAYKLARKGRAVQIEPRKVTIYKVSSVVYQWPKVIFTAEVSSGTYIRSLVEDIGTKLGVGAYTSSLRRTSIGKYCLDEAITIEGIDYRKIISSVTPLD